MALSYGKRVHNSSVSHAFTRLSNRRSHRDDEERVASFHSLVLQLKVIRTRDATDDASIDASPTRDLINRVTCNYRVLLRGVLMIVEKSLLLPTVIRAFRFRIKFPYRITEFF